MPHPPPESHSPAPKLIESAEWRLLGLLFERPRPAWREEIAALAREVASEGLKAAAQAASAATEGEYLALLGPGGAVSPREVGYRGMEDPGRLLADIGAFHRAFAFHPISEDPVDHVAQEIGLVGYLSLKVAFAEHEGNPEAATTTARARDTFIAAHLGVFAHEFARRLGAAASARSVGYLALAARILATRVPQSAQAAPRAAALPILTADGPDEMGCGSCPDPG